MTCPKMSAKTIMEIGAIGATVENSYDHSIMYINGRENEGAIESVIKNMPPLYKNNIRFEQVVL